MPRFPALSRRAVLIGLALVLVVSAVATAGVEAFSGPAPRRITAYFNETIAVYPGSDVRILGVKVGTVRAVHPEGTEVAAVLDVDRDVPVPAGADAVVVAPSVVADRYVQLTPAYTGGARLADHGSIPTSRTATPAELDQLYSAITRLADDLGPNGVNSKGALSDVLRTGAANLDGNGRALGNTIRRFGSAAQTLSGNSRDLFATLTNLEKFTTMLKSDDSQVSLAENRLASVTGFLSDDRQNLGAALNELATALGQVQGFIQSNRSRLKDNIDKLARVTRILVKERKSLAEALDTAPLAADNLLRAYDPAHGTLDGRGDLNELSMGASGAALSGAGGASGGGSPSGSGAGSGAGPSSSSSSSSSSSPMMLPSVSGGGGR